MEFICGVIDFSAEQKFNPLTAVNGLKKTVFFDNHVILCRFFEDSSQTTLSANESFVEISINDTVVSYDIASHTANFTCGSSGKHRFFFTFSGSALIFSTDLNILVPSDKTPYVLFGNDAYKNITELKTGKSGTFSPQGIKIY